jgi:hypothetical protein
MSIDIDILADFAALAASALVATSWNALRVVTRRACGGPEEPPPHAPTPTTNAAMPTTKTKRRDRFTGAPSLPRHINRLDPYAT